MLVRNVNVENMKVKERRITAKRLSPTSRYFSTKDGGVPQQGGVGDHPDVGVVVEDNAITPVVPDDQPDGNHHHLEPQPHPSEQGRFKVANTLVEVTVAAAAKEGLWNEG